jgi:hypothetical protein
MTMLSFSDTRVSPGPGGLKVVDVGWNVGMVVGGGAGMVGGWIVVIVVGGIVGMTDDKTGVTRIGWAVDGPQPETSTLATIKTMKNLYLRFISASFG